EGARTRTKQQLEEFLQRRIVRCYPGAQVVDVKQVPSSSSGEYEVGAYFVVPPAGALTLRFPFDAGFLPETGDARHRETDLLLWRDVTATKSVFTLPKGFRPTGLPSPQVLKTPQVEGKASWEMTEEGLKATLDFKVKTSRIPAADCRQLEQAVAALESWLDRPLTLAAGDQPVMTATGNDLGEFPIMPSGAGQIQLVNQRFPSTGNRQLRRAALEKTLEYFPKDAATQFNAQVQLAYLDTMEDQHDRALQRVRAPMETLRGSVTVEDAALGDYIVAIIHKNRKEDAEAIRILDKVVANDQVSEYRRSWSQQHRAALLAKTDKPKAIEALLAGLALDGDNHSDLLARLAELRLDAGQETELKKELAQYLEQHSDATTEVMPGLASLAEAWSHSKPETALKLIAILDASGDASAFGQEYAESMKNARLEVDSGKAYAVVRKHLQQWMQAHPESVPDVKVSEDLKTAEDFLNKIEALLKVDNQAPLMPEAIRLSLECLTRFEPGEWYEERLWRLGTYADLLDVTDEKKETPPVLLAVLDACDMTPEGRKAHTEGRYLRGRQLVRSEKLKEADELLQSLVANPKMGLEWRITAVERLGTVRLQLKDYEGALKNWDELGQYLEYGTAADELLRATLLSLQMGQSDRATKYLKLLQQMKPSVREKADAKQQLESLLELAADERALKNWWAASEKWWPEWLAFERKHGTPVPEGEVVMPTVGSAEEIGRLLGDQARAKQQREVFASLRRLIHAGRWDPLFALETAGLLPYLEQLNMGDTTPDFRKLIIAIYEAGGFEKPLYRRSIHLWGAISFADSKMAPRALEVVETFLKEEQGTPDGTTTAMARVQAMAAIASGEKLGPSATLLERLLTTPNAVPDSVRLPTVSALSALYAKLGRNEAEIVLIERELEHPVIAKSGNGAAQMKQRLELLREGGGAGDGPANAAKAWLAVRKPGWYDHARPKDLQDPKAENAEEMLRSGSGLLPVEAIKLCLLLAQDASQADPTRLDALVRLGWYMHAATPSIEEAGPWLEAVIAEKSLPRRLRALHVDSFLRHAFVSEDREAIRRYIDHPILEGLQPEDAVHHKTFRRWAAVEPTDYAGLKQLALSLMEEPLTYFASEAAERCLMALAFAGKADEARSVYENLGRARFEKTSDKSPRQLAALKIINRAKKLVPVQEELMALYLKHRPLPSGAPPVKLACTPDVRFNLSEADATAVREGWLRDGTWPRHSLEFWFDLLSDQPHTAEREDLALALLTLALEKAPEDGDRADLILSCSGFVDIDNPATREKLAAALKPYRNRPDAPRTADALKARDLLTQMRVGKPVDAFAVFGAIRDTRMQSRVRWSLFRRLYADQDKAGLKRLVEMTSVEELLSPLYTSLTPRIYNLLDMKDEAELASEQAREAVYESVLRSWVDPDRRTSYFCLHTADTIGDASLIPAGLAEELIPATRHTREKLFLSILDARLRKDWEACTRHAAEGRKLYPTFYDFYLFEGLALGHLGRGEEAVKPLQIFLDHVHDDPDCVPARQMLERLSKKQP
ncbi:MAG: tol-pal system YbgF family protein, partial [Roseimicrobium sp.]